MAKITRRLNDTAALQASRRPRNPLLQSTDAKGGSFPAFGFEGAQNYNPNYPVLSQRSELGVDLPNLNTVISVAKR